MHWISYIFWNVYHYPERWKSDFNIFNAEKSILKSKCLTRTSDNSKYFLWSLRLRVNEFQLYDNLRETFGKFFRSYSGLLSKFCAISFQEYIKRNPSLSLVRWYHVQNTSKEGQVRGELHLVVFENSKMSLDRTPNFCQNLVIFRSKNMYLKESLTRSSTVI